MRDMLAAKKAKLEGLPSLRKAVRGKIEEVIKVDDLRNQAAMRTRSDPRMLERWMKYTKAESPEDIDYGDACVWIEWCACDPAVYGMADDPDRFVAETGCDRDVFMRHYWPETEGA